MGTTRDAGGSADGTSGVVLPFNMPQWQTPEQVEITRLSTQLDAGHRRLNFVEPLEAMFRRDYEIAAAGPRTVLLVMGIVMVGITPLYDAALLHAPAEYLLPSHLIQWCLMLPPLSLMLIVQRWKPVTHDALKQSLTVGAALAAWAGLTAQHAIAGYYDFHFPSDFGLIAIAATFAMARLRFYRFLPWATAALVVSLAVELLRVFPTGQTLGAAIYNSMSLSMLWVVAATGAWLFEHVSRNAWLRQEIYRRLAIHDTLTGLSNRRHFQTVMERLIRRAERERKPVAVMLIDVDHFKAFNDHYGHVAGDDCLRRIGAWLSTGWRRPDDLRARIGGEEFVAVWIGIEAGEIAEYADDLRAGIERLAIAHAASPTAPSVTASAGLIHGIPTARTSADVLIRSADALLYSAKAAGRNRLLASIGSLDVPARTSTVVPFSNPVSNSTT